MKPSTKIVSFLDSVVRRLIQDEYTSVELSCEEEDELWFYNTHTYGGDAVIARLFELSLLGYYIEYTETNRFRNVYEWGGAACTCVLLMVRKSLNHQTNIDETVMSAISRVMERLVKPPVPEKPV